MVFHVSACRWVTRKPECVMRAANRLRQRDGVQAFTLIEVMIVVAIIGVLASIGIASYVRQIRRTRIEEARTVMLEIAAKQELFESFSGQYVTTNALCPVNLGGGGKAVPFNVAGCTGAANWQTLGVNVPRNTWFQFGFLAGTPGGAACAAPAGFPEACDSIIANTHWYVIFAQADQDGDGVLSRLITSSTMDGEVFMADELE